MRTLLLFFAVLVAVSPIAIQIHPRQQRCFTVDGGSQYEIQYIVAGLNQSNINFTVVHNNSTILEKLGLKEYKETIFLPVNSSLCFSITDDYSKVLVLDFFPDTDLIKTLITKKDLKEVGQALTQSYAELKNVYRNQEFQIQRDRTHKSLMDQTQGKIKWSGIAKIVMLLGSALVQVCVMKRFFNSRSKEYQSVET